MNLTSLKFTNRDLLLIIDVQNDFVSGVLGTKRAQALIPDIAQFIRDFTRRTTCPPRRGGTCLSSIPLREPMAGS